MNYLQHRIGQFFLYLRARPTTADYTAVDAVLPPALGALFRRMTAGEQVHCLKVMRELTRRGHTRPELLQAALLHDVGKARAPLNLLERVEAVLVRWLAPKAYFRWAQSEPRGWKKPFVTAVQHPEWGAEMAAAAEAAPLVVNLIRRHQACYDHPENRTDEDCLLWEMHAAETEMEL